MRKTDVFRTIYLVANTLLFRGVWAVNRLDAILEVAIVKHIDVERLATWHHAQHDVAVIARKRGVERCVGLLE